MKKYSTIELQRRLHDANILDVVVFNGIARSGYCDSACETTSDAELKAVARQACDACFANRPDLLMRALAVLA